jgi:hypothetical protein
MNIKPTAKITLFLGASTLVILWDIFAPEHRNFC